MGRSRPLLHVARSRGLIQCFKYHPCANATKNKNFSSELSLELQTYPISYFVFSPKFLLTFQTQLIQNRNRDSLPSYFSSLFPVSEHVTTTPQMFNSKSSNYSWLLSSSNCHIQYMSNTSSYWYISKYMSNSTSYLCLHYNHSQTFSSKPLQKPF